MSWLERFVDELGLAPAVLVGNCMGSLTALHYAPQSVAALVLMNMLDSEVGAAGPMGRGAGLLKLRALRPLLEWAVVHTPVRLALTHPYPHSQFGDLADAAARSYHEHAIQRFSDPQTRLTLIRLGYDSPNHVLPPPRPTMTPCQAALPSDHLDHQPVSIRCSRCRDQKVITVLAISR